MQSYGWLVEVDDFQDNTPYGQKNFANLIANYPIGVNFASKTDQLQSSDFVLNKRVVFACHYDSKYFDQFDFIAATDSAVPCAILLDMAKFLSENFDKSEFNKVGFEFELYTVLFFNRNFEIVRLKKS